MISEQFVFKFHNLFIIIISNNTTTWCSGMWCLIKILYVVSVVDEHWTVRKTVWNFTFMWKTGISSHTILTRLVVVELHAPGLFGVRACVRVWVGTVSQCCQTKTHLTSSSSSLTVTHSAHQLCYKYTIAFFINVSTKERSKHTARCR